jgi:IS605 OrfB family transposase
MRLLKHISGKESRFASIVAKAKDTHRAIALEDLTGISTRVTVRKAQRATLHSWSFYQLRQYITYKAKLAGIPVILVDPRNTSRTCPACGCIDKRNRPNQSSFLCVKCGHADHADHNAAENIRRAVIKQPNVGTTAPPTSSCP